jgi:hypothetical protein
VYFKGFFEESAFNEFQSLLSTAPLLFVRVVDFAQFGAN